MDEIDTYMGSRNKDFVNCLSVWVSDDGQATATQEDVCLLSVCGICSVVVVRVWESGGLQAGSMLVALTLLHARTSGDGGADARAPPP